LLVANLRKKRAKKISSMSESMSPPVRNFKKFKGNKMADIARKRAIVRHVDFDIIVEERFLTDKWISAASKETEVSNEIDVLLNSTRKPTKMKKQSLRPARSARSRNAGAGGGSRRGHRKARRR